MSEGTSHAYPCRVKPGLFRSFSCLRSSGSHGRSLPLQRMSFDCNKLRGWPVPTWYTSQMDPLSHDGCAPKFGTPASRIKQHQASLLEGPSDHWKQGLPFFGCGETTGQVENATRHQQMRGVVLISHQQGAIHQSRKPLQEAPNLSLWTAFAWFTPISIGKEGLNNNG